MDAAPALAAVSLAEMEAQARAASDVLEAINRYRDPFEVGDPREVKSRPIRDAAWWKAKALWEAVFAEREKQCPQPSPRAETPA